jgi:hypothetical protein
VGIDMTTSIEDPCCQCGRESEFGAHGIRENEVYDEYYCESCWNSNRNTHGKRQIESENREQCDGLQPREENGGTKVFHLPSQQGRERFQETQTRDEEVQAEG